MSILIFGAISSIVVTAKVGILTLNNRYGIVESSEDGHLPQCAIVIDLENYYIMEPAREVDGDLIIETGQFTYAGKDDVVVTLRRYDRVLVERH